MVRTEGGVFMPPKASSGFRIGGVSSKVVPLRKGPLDVCSLSSPS